MVAAVRMTYRVRAQRDGRWWVLSVPDVPGALSQVRSLADAKDWIREAIAAVVNVDPDSFDIELDVELPTLSRDVRTVRRAVSDAERAQREAAALSRQLVAELRAAGVTVVDTAALLDISPQRVSQLANS
jgi:predicted RNase H-like HicB family nuclease